MDKELFCVELKSLLDCGNKIDFSIAMFGNELIYVVRINTNNDRFYQSIDSKLESAMYKVIKQYREKTCDNFKNPCVELFKKENK